MRSTTRCRTSCARFERMRGKDVLWQPGTDHAGIATQMVVERQLMERQEPGRRDMGREKFLERVWAWKAESRRHHRQPAQAARRVLRLVARALHHGRGAVARRAEGVRSALQRRPDLQGQAAGQLGPEAAHRDLRPRGAAGRGQGQPLAHQVSDRGHRASTSSSPPRGPRRCWATPRSRCIRTTRRYKHSDRQERDPAAGRPRAFRSSPTTMPIRRRAPARSRSRRRTTSTTSRSASGTTCRR